MHLRGAERDGGEVRSPCALQNYPGCPVERGGALREMQRGCAVLAGECGLLRRGPAVMEGTGAVAILREIGWDCEITQRAPGCSLRWVRGLCPGLLPQRDLFGDR